MGKKIRRRSRKSGNTAIFWIIGIFFLLSIGGGLTWYLVKKSRKGTTDSTAKEGAGAAPELKKVLEETDRKDPGWRLRDLAANQRKLEDAKNGANIVLAVGKQIPRDVVTSLKDLSGRKIPSQPLPDQEVNQLRNYLQSCGNAVAEARKINFYPDGVYWITFNLKSPLDTLLEHAQHARVVASVLLADALVRAADRDGLGSVQAGYALMNLSRYHQDEPFLICQLVRVAIRSLGIIALERALTCANVPDDALNLLQQMLELEGAAFPLRVALRGERANIDALATSVAKGDMTWPGAKLSDEDVAWCIRQLNTAIDVTVKPVAKQHVEWQTLSTEIARGSQTALSIMPNIEKVRTALVRSVAQMRSAAIAVAVERYRRAKGDWPSDLKQLVPDYMKALPEDPYTGEQFRYARVNEGVTVYAVGKGTTDSKGAFLTIGFQENENVGFRLINANLRR